MIRLQFDLTMRTGLMTIIGLVGIIALFVMVMVSIFMYIKTLHIIIAIIGTLLVSMVNINFIQYVSLLIV